MQNYKNVYASIHVPCPKLSLCCVYRIKLYNKFNSGGGSNKLGQSKVFKKGMGFGDGFIGTKKGIFRCMFYLTYNMC